MSSKRRLISYASLVFFAVVFAWYVKVNWTSFQEITFTEPLLLIPAALMVVVNIYCIGAVLDVAIEPHGIKLSKKEILGLSSVTRFANNISPTYLGAAVRALYLKKTYKISYTKIGSSFALSNIIQLAISGSLILALLILQSQFTLESSFSVILLISIATIGLLLLVPLNSTSDFLHSQAQIRSSKLLRRLSAIIREYSALRSNPSLFFKMLFWTLGALASSSLLLYSLYLALGDAIGIEQAVFIAIIAGWSIVFSITPGNFGVTEGLLVLGAQLVGVSIPVTIAVALLRRLLTFATNFLLAAYFAPKLLNTSIGQIGQLDEKGQEE